MAPLLSEPVSASHLAARVTPTACTLRYVPVDVLRSVALLGISLVNLTGEAEPSSAVDEMAARFVDTLAFGKFYPIFALLFGVGFATQLRRAESSRGFTWRFVRRILALYGFGALFFVLIGGTNVLLSYAVIGLPLLLFRAASTRTLALAAIVLLSAGAAFPALRLTLAGPIEQPTPAVLQQQQARYEDWRGALVRGNYPAVVAAQARWFADRFPRVGFEAPIFTLVAFAAFLVGMIAERHGVFARPAHVRGWWLLLAGGIVVDVLITLNADRLGTTVYVLGSVPLASAYVAAIMLLLHTDTGAMVLLPLRWAGQMTLTNYFLQGVCATALVIGPASYATCVLVAVVSWLILQVSSWWWLTHHRLGPLEWAWRYATYLNRPAWSR